MSISYINGNLCIGTGSGRPFHLKELAANYSNPIYVYDWDDIKSRLLAFRSAFSAAPEIHYAVKANANPELLRRLRQLHVGADVVSLGEIFQAMQAGFSPSEIIFSGVGKTKSELRFAIQNEIKQINVESPQELERVGSIAKELGRVARVGIRINPDVDPDTHPYITTGFRENKFGMDASFLPEIFQILDRYRSHIAVKGTAIHIGSQLLELSCIFEAIEKTIPVFQQFREYGFPVETFDIGGGLGVNYRESDEDEIWKRIAQYGEGVSKRLAELDVRILCEPGRVLVGPPGVLLTEVQYVKKTPFKNFAIVDTGMHHLLRPSLYQAYHRILPVSEAADHETLSYDVVGPICESSDVLGRDRMFRNLQPGDILAIADAGAYGFSMASFYNAHEFPKEYLVDEGKVLDITQSKSRLGHLAAELPIQSI